MHTTSLSRAIDPQHNCVVSASAGTGKTWLLISRVLRLLLADTAPGNIVAITFTRKAAAEMQTRLTERLKQFATCPSPQLENLLYQLELPAEKEHVQIARLLYERLLHHPYQVKATTYHAFCQELLRRFPLEANIPPGFELHEQTQALQSEAWDELFSESTRNPTSPTSSALNELFNYCGNLHNVKSALLDFLEHRLDWWLLTDTSATPLQFALDNLQRRYHLSSLEWNPEEFFDAATLRDLRCFQDLLDKHATAKHQNESAILQTVLDLCARRQHESAFVSVTQVFLTKEFIARVRKPSGVQAKNMGTTGQAQFLALQDSISESIIDKLNQKTAIQNVRVNRAWYITGHRLTEIYQAIKLSRRILDFNDLEWHSYQLLQHADSAQWVQYKLDSRIDHLLIDEFQDTNPTQWQLVLPLLQELAATRHDRPRSVFIVGDEKQSIYRFRRAEPKLLSIAQQWLSENLNAATLQISKSWRSAQLLMDFVNIIFSDGPLRQRLNDFPHHSTNYPDLYGRVEVFPLIEADPAQTEAAHLDFRNPLEQPRLDKPDTRYAREAERIAATIDNLISSETVINASHGARSLDYGDIVILLRSRTHAAEYEHALRAYDIPYSGGDKSGLLDCLEIQDMMALLETLVTPYNNLAVAHVLRSPLFNISHADLQYLAASPAKQSWYEYLLSDTCTQASPALQRARHCLPRWHDYASHLPVHDVLDKIYHEADVLNAFQREAPTHLRGRVAANLQHFIELALDLDSGRYPSMQMFLWNLQQAKTLNRDVPEQPDIRQHGSYVRILTIHAAKGLEAAVVFLADAARTPQAAQAYQATVDWPVSAGAPQQFFMRADSKRTDEHMQSTLDRLAVDELREDAHLLYVAITRPKQYLYISGVQPLRGEDLGWYGAIFAQCNQLSWGQHDPQGGIRCESGHPDKIASGVKTKGDSVSASEAKSALQAEPLAPTELPERASHIPTMQAISPSQGLKTVARPNAEQIVTDTDDSIDALERGQLIHRAIELLTDGHDKQYVFQQLETESSGHPGIKIPIDEAIDEAYGVYLQPELQFLFNNANIQQAYNEVPLSYVQDGNHISGIIDRLVIHETDIYIVDYKSHRVRSETRINSIAEQYRPQMELYRRGILNLWHNRQIHMLLIFTHLPRMVRLAGRD